jgi:hypothetical protein
VDEIEAGKAAFNALLAEVDPQASAVIPTRASDDRFLIALTSGGRRVFITVSEDDLIDLPEDADVAGEVRDRVREALAGG